MTTSISVIWKFVFAIFVISRHIIRCSKNIETTICSPQNSKGTGWVTFTDLLLLHVGVHLNQGQWTQQLWMTQESCPWSFCILHASCKNRSHAREAHPAWIAPSLTQVLHIKQRVPADSEHTVLFKAQDEVLKWRVKKTEKLELENDSNQLINYQNCLWFS